MNQIGFAGFDILVISLRKSSERRRQSAQQLDAMGFAWGFLDAIDGRALAAVPGEYDRYTRLRLAGFEMSPGQIGCFLSHRAAWKQCVERQKPMLILEDDFQFQQNLGEVLPFIHDHFSAFDVLRLHGLFNGFKYKVLRDCGQRKLVRHYYDPSGCTAYIIKPGCARVMLEKSQRFHAPVDDFFGHDWIHRQNILSVLPFPVMPSGLPSTIEVEDAPRSKLSVIQKLQTKVNKIPRSIQKRFYRMTAFPGLFIQKTDGPDGHRSSRG